MAAEIISGTEMARTIREEIRVGVDEFKRTAGRPPGLATVLVGANPASQSYVRMKKRAALDLGMYSRQIELDREIPEDELLGWIEGLNADPDIHGILVQLPLPPQIRKNRVLEAIHPAKDVDGFHPINVGRMVVGDPAALSPCTPLGVVEMLVRSGIQTRGRHAVVVGRSDIVGKPMGSMLLGSGPGGDATVTVTHILTRDLAAHTRMADILVVAAGHPDLITADMVKPGVVVIDVGVNRVADPSREKGYRLTGDVAFEEVREVASVITPVPGGVGPMTIAMLLSNTLKAARSLTRAVV
ncbi:MAG: bifunctional 5,10-methylenetetrahydrofolate dehydrogenase/5,10-methenyltetrahydrofolate cyclohydrolase [Gemmatimonadales bacterium]|nr:MAG: bifunctional 5,10-methylenetetrahydrofolate dehydrogenase/5,10-methenyltetrahydrofolate cyclohydrolase [Gemmatimonadales bacterium]